MINREPFVFKLFAIDGLATSSLKNHAKIRENKVSKKPVAARKE